MARSITPEESIKDEGNILVGNAVALIHHFDSDLVFVRPLASDVYLLACGGELDCIPERFNQRMIQIVCI